MNERVVESWRALQEALYEGSWQPALGRFRSDQAFRGMGDASEDLRTALVRRCGASRDIENHLLRNFRKYASGHARQRDSVWHWLALGQHHGLPTRLLDWTYSPLVALHFATAHPGEIHCDAVVWCVDFVKANRLLPAKLRRLLEAEGSNVFTVDMLERAATSLQAFDELHRRDAVLFFEPPSLDERIVNQFALFSLMSGPALRLDGWLRGHPELYRRIVIPARLKWEVRDKLDQANVTERVLFPGLDGLSRWLARHYSPGPAERGRLERPWPAVARRSRPAPPTAAKARRGAGRRPRGSAR